MTAIVADHQNKPVTKAELLRDRHSSVAVLISSCDSRRDVLSLVLLSCSKYWPNCPYPIYVGLNSNAALGARFEVIVAEASEWRGECIEQISQINATHLILLLDDFLILRSVNEETLGKLVSVVLEHDLQYLRLWPMGISLTRRLSNVVSGRRTIDIQEIAGGHPFYSGLQIAIWNKQHLLELLKLPGSIWEFERRTAVGKRHFAITRSPPIIYTHLVERGRWLPHAKSLLTRVGLPSDLGKRPTWPSWIRLRLFLDKVRHLVIGYATY